MRLRVERSAFKRCCVVCIRSVIAVGRGNRVVLGSTCLMGYERLSRVPWNFVGYDDGVGLSTDDAVLIALLHEACW
jgi:hypothetical protein